MVNAVVTGGTIQPLEPLPIDWREGQSVRIEKADDPEMSLEVIERDFAELERLCATSDAANEELMERAIHDAHRLAKEQVRRQMGLA